MDTGAAGSRARSRHVSLGGPLTLRLLLWNLADSKTTLAELRERLPELPEGDLWISHESSERFGIVSLSDEPLELDEIRQLIGKEPDLGEEFDVE